MGDRRVIHTDAANELAALAVDLLCDPPAERPRGGSALAQPKARVDWELVEEGRRIMERHGIHWRALKADNERPMRRGH